MLKLLPIMIMLELAGCKQDRPAPVKSPDRKPFNNIHVRTLFEHLATAPQTYTLHGSRFSSLVCEQGTRISTEPQTFLMEAGATISDTVLLEVRELFSKKAMILNNAVPLFTGRLMPLEGSVSVKASGTGLKKLNTGPGYIHLLMPVHHKPSKQALALYASSDGISSNLTWLIHASDQMTTQQDSSGIRAFYQNADPRRASTCTVYLTGRFNNSNTVVFLSMNGTSALTALHSPQSSISQTFTSSENSIPVDASYTVVALSFDGMHFYHLLYPLTMSANRETTIPPLVLSSRSRIISALNTL